MSVKIKITEDQADNLKNIQIKGNEGDLYVVEFAYIKFNTLQKKVCVAYYEDDGGDEGGRWFNNTTDRNIDVTKTILNLKTYV